MSNNIFLMNADTGKIQEFGKLSLPEFKVSNNSDWVINGVMEDWYNRQPQFYEYLKRTSPKHGAIIKTKNRYVYGKGFEIDKAGLSITEIIALKSFLKKIKDLRVVKKIIADRTDQGGFAVEMIASKDGNTWLPNYLSMKDIRIGKLEYEKDGTEKPLRYFYTKDWTKKAQAKGNIDFVEMFPFPWDKKLIKKGQRYIVYFKDADSDDAVYPLPEYISGLPYIEADALVGNFVKNNVLNGFSAGLLVNLFNGVPSPEQQEEIQSDWKKAKHGTDNAGDAILSFNETGSEGVKVEQINPNGQDDRFINLNNQNRDEIFTAHTISPLVVGMKGDNGFSNNADEIRTARELFTEDYAIPIQEIFNEFINSVLMLNDIRGEVYLKRLDPIKPQLSETTLREIASYDEIREIAGLPKSKRVVNELATALSSISPLVANKILESMALAEIRAIVNLKTAEEGVIKKTEISLKEFSKEQDLEIIQAFSECGLEDEGTICFDSKELHAKDVFDAFKQASNFKQEFSSKVESAILKIKNSDPKITTKELAKLLQDTPKNIQSVMDKMEADGLLENGTVSEKGKQEIEDNEIFVVYKYDLRLDAPKLIGVSRDFCIEMMALSKTRSWTIDDIQTISNRVGYDVFTRRGGWYHNPSTDKNTPYCRHTWNQRLVRKK